MILRVGGGEQIIRDAVTFENFDEAFMKPLVHFLDGLALLIGADGDRRAVRVCAADHKDFISFKPMIACDDITGQMGTCDITNMDFGVGVRPGDGNQNIFRHSFLSFLFTTKLRKGKLKTFVDFVFDVFEFTNKKAVRNWDSLSFRQR